jgi:hypothetical protein
MAFNRQPWNHRGSRLPQTTEDSPPRDFVPIPYLYDANQLVRLDRNHINPVRQFGFGSEYGLHDTLDQSIPRPQRIVEQYPPVDGQSLVPIWETPVINPYRDTRFTSPRLLPSEYLGLPRRLPLASTVLTYDDMIDQRMRGSGATGLDDSGNGTPSYHAPSYSAPIFSIPSHGALRYSAAGIATPSYGVFTSQLVPYAFPAYSSREDPAAVRYALQRIDLNQNQFDRRPQSHPQVKAGMSIVSSSEELLELVDPGIRLARDRTNTIP